MNSKYVIQNEILIFVLNHLSSYMLSLDWRLQRKQYLLYEWSCLWLQWQLPLPKILLWRLMWNLQLYCFNFKCQKLWYVFWNISYDLRAILSGLSTCPLLLPVLSYAMVVWWKGILQWSFLLWYMAQLLQVLQKWKETKRSH